MKRIDASEQKQIMLNLLIQLKEYCDKNRIQFFLDSGTLLGAIRHNGFIPWDDDIDVCMLRMDYDKFYETTKITPICDYIDVYREREGLFPYIKIVDNRTELIEYPDTLRLKLGVYIDIFPKDGHPKSNWRAIFHCKQAQLWTNLYWFNRYSVKVWKNSTSLHKRIIAKMLSPLVEDSFFPLSQAIKVAQKYKIDDDGDCSSILAGGIRGKVPVKYFRKSKMVDFEGVKMPAPIGYDQYLRKLYENINNGDYMVLPPKEKREIHETEVYWKEGYGE